MRYASSARGIFINWGMRKCGNWNVGGYCTVVYVSTASPSTIARATGCLGMSRDVLHGDYSTVQLVHSHCFDCCRDTDYARDVQNNYLVSPRSRSSVPDNYNPGTPQVIADYYIIRTAQASAERGQSRKRNNHPSTIDQALLR